MTDRPHIPCTYSLPAGLPEPTPDEAIQFHGGEYVTVGSSEYEGIGHADFAVHVWCDGTWEEIAKTYLDDCLGPEEWFGFAASGPFPNGGWFPHRYWTKTLPDGRECRVEVRA